LFLIFPGGFVVLTTKNRGSPYFVGHVARGRGKGKRGKI